MDGLLDVMELVRSVVPTIQKPGVYDVVHEAWIQILPLFEGSEQIEIMTYAHKFTVEGACLTDIDEVSGFWIFITWRGFFSFFATAGLSSHQLGPLVFSVGGYPMSIW